jgi:predicted ArsR family transcriptional regulator
MLVRPSAFNSIAKRTDYETCLTAFREARRLLSEYINPCSPSESVETLDQIIDILDNDTVEAALRRIDGRDHFGLVECPKYVSVAEDEPLDDAG